MIFLEQAMVSSRDQFPALLAALGLNGVGVEVGALRGAYSQILLNGSNLKKLYSVDSWREDIEDAYRDINSGSQDFHDRNRREAEERLAPFGERSEILWMTSRATAHYFENESLDFVYIDANHSYLGCREDLELWWPKLKVGGLFSGDDFIPDGVYEQGEFAVMGAVTEFCEKKFHNISVTQDLWPSWYMLKKAL